MNGWAMKAVGGDEMREVWAPIPHGFAKNLFNSLVGDWTILKIEI